VKPRIVLMGDGWEYFRPITLTRPLAEVRAGAFTFRERIQKLFYDSHISVMARPMVAEAYTARTGILTNKLPKGKDPVLIIRPSAIYNMDFYDAVFKASPGTMFKSGKVVVAALVEEKKIPKTLNNLKMPAIRVDVPVIENIWDLVNRNNEAIELDYTNCFGPEKHGHIDKGATIYNSPGVHVAKSAEIRAGAVLDAREGHIIIDEEAIIYPGVVIAGPCYIGKKNAIVSGWIRSGCSFGPDCRIGGEVEMTVFQGYANKYHEGFIGHSYIGEWANLGALTTTSDLKNNYSNIRIDLGSGPIDTKLTKVGSFIGDHTKTGIGTLLNSGTSLGVYVNHYGSEFPPKYVRSFSWGTATNYMEYDIEKALETARIVMERREMKLLPEEEKLLRFIHSLRK